MREVRGDGHGTGMNKPLSQPRIEHLGIRNYRALRHVELRNLMPLTVLVGPNGSGKSTVLDALSFVSDCFRVGLQQAWSDRGYGQELKTRGENGSVEISIGYREQPAGKLITYLLEIDEEDGKPVVHKESVTVKGRTADGIETILEHTKIPGEDEGKAITKGSTLPNVHAILVGADLLAVNVFGQIQGTPVLTGLRRFILDWQRFEPSIENVRGQLSGGPQQRLNGAGDNLANVILYLSRHDPERLDRVFRVLAQRVPQVEKAVAEEMTDGRLILRIKDAPFHDPIFARFASDGTLKMLAFLLLLDQPTPPTLIGIEEPKNYLHPRLMYSLAEEFRSATERSQLLVTTHSPYFLDALRPEEVRVLYRNEHGHTQAQRAADLHGVKEFMEHGGLLGDLWMEGHFNVGDPLTNSGMPRRAAGL